jgi:hypothetical protein
MRRLLTVILLTGIFSSCTVIKTISVLQKGKVAQKNFREQVPFESRAGLIVIRVTINGREHHFIFDSGATNCVTKELAEELKLKPVLDQTAEDAEGRKGGVQFALIDELKIGNISFANTGAAIIDLQAVPELACLQVDGLIGANLMRKACWQIDYKKQTLTFSDRTDSLTFSEAAFSFGFYPVVSGTPLIDVEVNGVKSKENVFDTGSSGDVLLPGKTFEKLLKKKESPLQYIRGAGSNSAGLYGAGNDTAYVADIADFKLGTHTISHQAVQFKKFHKGNLGSGFFKNYIVTLNWKNKKIWFDPQPASVTSESETFGFSPIRKDKKLLIGFLYENSVAAKAGLKVGDQILSINERNYNPLQENEYCDLIVKNAPWRTERSLVLRIQPADGSPEKSISLDRNSLLK